VKVCTKCGIEKELDEFHASMVSKDGHKSRCKLCRNKENLIWAKNNSEKIKAWRRANPEGIKKTAKRWRQNNSEYQRDYYRDNRKRINNQAAINYSKNPEKAKRRAAAWNKVNPERHRQAHKTYRARKRNQLGSMPPDAYKIILERYPICLFPGCEAAENLHVDHVISLKNGGLHDINNLQVLCGHHNISKGSKNIDYRDNIIGGKI